MGHAETLISAEQTDILMEQIIARAASCAHNTEVLVVEGLVPTRQHPFADEINSAIAKALDADVVFVGTPGTDTPKEFNKRLKITHQSWGGNKNKSLIGAIINKVNAPVDEEGRTRQIYQKFSILTTQMNQRLSALICQRKRLLKS